MSFFALDNLRSASGGRWLTPPQDAGRIADGISTDTRTMQPGHAFLALEGETFDAHNMLDQAVEKGASALIVSREQGVPSSVPTILVDETRAALLRLASAYRRTLTDTTVIAVTGSNGKTTTVRALHAVLTQDGPTHSSPKSYNNDIGVPLTILSTPPDAKYLVCEVGMNAPGEIAPLARAIRPDIGVITSIGTAHIEALGSRQAIAREKASLLAHLSAKSSLAVIPHDEPTLEPVRMQVSNILTVGHAPGAGVRVEGERTAIDDGAPSTSFRVDGDTFEVHLAGLHNATNAGIAVAIGRRLGHTDDQIREGLARVEAPENRLAIRAHGGVTIINDAYNANPESIRAALRLFDEIAPRNGRRALVIGEMAEQGEHARAAHERLADDIASIAPPDVLITVGDAARVTHERASARLTGAICVHAGTLTAESAREIAGMFASGDTVLLKGSRTNALERIERALRNTPHDNATQAPPCSTA